MRKWKPSKTAINNFKNEMEEIELYCIKNNIDASKTNDSYYFTIKGTDYRVSNHTPQASNAKAVNFMGEVVRDEYHNLADEVTHITAGKTRIIQIHKDLLAGKKLDKRGKVVC